MPDQLKSGVEQLSGMSMDDVKVHYNSSKPSQLNALAYAQGSQIHVAPGQEKHLPHEAWHVVQQKQGRVKPTTQMGDVDVNDNPSLESEADRMGASAARSGTGVSSRELADVPAPAGSAQLFKGMDSDNTKRLEQSRTTSGNAKMQLDHSVSQDMMKKLAETVESIGEMVRPRDTQFKQTKEKFNDFTAVLPASDSELTNTLLNLKNNITPGYQLTTGNPGSDFDPQIEMVGNKSMQTKRSLSIMKLDALIRRLALLPILNHQEAIDSYDEGLDNIIAATLDEITACLTEIQEGPAPVFDSSIWYDYKQDGDTTEKKVKKVSAEWLDAKPSGLGQKKDSYPANLDEKSFEWEIMVPVYTKNKKEKQKNNKQEVEIGHGVKKVAVSVSIPVECWKHIYDRHYIPTFAGKIEAINTFWKMDPFTAITQQLLQPEIDMLIEKKMNLQNIDEGTININEYVNMLFFQGTIDPLTIDSNESLLTIELKSIAPQDSGLGYGITPSLLQA
ncbi:DUF4157 domain-containing protein [Paenibacillus sp. NPDC058174]|uniref:eCIS core domain-containing protein n=1 Tax=Paenibacillus sp. NPDC058174 TaxID=3346366 RepID=UPI0036DF1558